MSVPDRRALLDRGHADLSIRRQCDLLGIARSRVRLLSGEKSRHKVLELDGVTEEEFLQFASSNHR